MADKEPEDIQKTFEEEIKKPYYDIFYLDKFKLPYDKLDVSVIIPTYNRCPYKPDSLKGELNPLKWAIDSIIAQKPKVSEVVIVNDGSDDYTDEVVNSMAKELEDHDIILVYKKNKTQKGNAMARDIASRAADSKYLLFIDDDCIFPPHCAFGGVYTFEKLAQRGINIGAINLPTYFRRSIPKRAVSKKDIGKIDFVRGLYTTNKDAFPIEYLNGKEEKKFLDVELHILEPFPITNFNSFSICSKKAYQDVGGFKDTVIKRGIDREFGAALTENGYDIYFQPDPKFHTVHGSYGLNNGVEFEGPDYFRQMGGDLSLKKAMAECDKPTEKSGMRIDQKEYLLQQIISFFVLTYPRNKKGALKWIEKVYSDFVANGKTSVFGGIQIIVPTNSERKEMWKEAIDRGIEFLKKKESKNIKKAERILKKLESEKRDFNEAVKLIAEV